MKHILFDTNILLDIALDRDPFVEDAAKVLQLMDMQVITGYITANSITDIYYIIKKAKGHSEGIAFIIDLLDLVMVIGVDESVIKGALKTGMKDFEDAIQAFCAKQANLDMIITRNETDFARSGLLVLDAYNACRYLIN